MPDGLFANPLHWVILLVIVLIVFGPGKLPSVGNALGKSVREFKKASQEDDSPSTFAQMSAAQPAVGLQSGAAMAAPSGVACPSCGHENAGEATFCTECGAALAKVVTPEPVPSATEHITCQSCGTENHGSNRFCAHCGSLLESTMTRA